MDYITAAARTSSASWPGIVFQHVLPSHLADLSGEFRCCEFGLAVIAEASLSYLGLGAPPPNASWGRLLREAQGHCLHPRRSARSSPGIALVSLVIGVNLLADGLRDIGDPTRRASR